MQTKCQSRPAGTEGMRALKMGELARKGLCAGASPRVSRCRLPNKKVVDLTFLFGFFVFADTGRLTPAFPDIRCASGGSVFMRVADA